ncbi:TPR repeat protein [Caulobacter ginsengisoli]|uniref:TPR repeat protein n=1 Tax=Caulobacter ginsengisoli TaxID=400775 RepID=A0ABU0IWL4_9CAUL|nr:tetratricopeptide repeat protein [Caulobacter ginsengisoli]MDQ0465736.1 TPR repeat protein [Caulobacter ginsengisoli]
MAASPALGAQGAQLNVKKTCREAHRDDLGAQLGLANGYFYDPGGTVTNDIPRRKVAFCLYLDGANRGDAEAQLRAAFMAELGLGGAAPDPKLAAHWYERAALQGNLIAQKAMARVMMNGLGRARDPVAAVDWWRRAAEGGDLQAQLNMSGFYQRGDIVPKSEQQATYWCERAANNGDLTAQFDLGRHFHHGYGRPIDLQQARKWYKIAADRGWAPAKANLGLMYALAEGGPRDDKQAQHYLEQAAALKDPIGLYGLGWLYQQGRLGRTRAERKTKAIQLFQEAARLGNPDARIALSQLGAPIN